MYYGPIWFSLLAISIIYVAAGIKIYISERRFQGLSPADQLISAAPSRETSAEQQAMTNQQTGETQLPPGPEDSRASGGPHLSSNQLSSQSVPVSRNQPLHCNESNAENISTGILPSIARSQQELASGSVSPKTTRLIGSVRSPTQTPLEQQSTPRRNRSFDSLSALSELAQPFPRNTNVADPERGHALPSAAVLRHVPESPEKEAAGRRGSFETKKSVRAYTKFACLYFLALAITWV